MRFECRIPWVIWVAQGLQQQCKGHLGDCQVGFIGFMVFLERQGGGESTNDSDSTLAPKSATSHTPLQGGVVSPAVWETQFVIPYPVCNYFVRTVGESVVRVSIAPTVDK